MTYLFFTIPLLVALGSCTAQDHDPEDGGWPRCATVPSTFVLEVQRTLNDSTDLFQGAYPIPPGLTCDLLEGLQQRLQDDSARYHFDRFSRRYWAVDGRNTAGFRFIRRHMDFDLSIAATAHWNADVRIMALDEVMNYRRMRPMVCTTKEGYARLEEQDRRTVRYLIHVLESTPLFISGSENSTIHGVYIDRILRTLDLFNGTSYFPKEEGRLHGSYSDKAVNDAIIHWKEIAP